MNVPENSERFLAARLAGRRGRENASQARRLKCGSPKFFHSLLIPAFNPTASRV